MRKALDMARSDVRSNADGFLAQCALGGDPVHRFV